MNILDEIRELRHDYECQCKENGIKQEKIHNLNKKIEELEKRIKKLEIENKALKGGKK